MFNKRTVFVVGAGASAEVGLPVGNKLKEIIAEKVDLYFEPAGDLVRGDKNIVDELKAYLQSQRSQSGTTPYLLAGRKIASAMPLALSIDNFLHTHSEDSESVLMGKLGIAASIIEAERGCTLYLEKTGEHLNFRDIPESWHSTFCKMLFEGVQKADVEKIFDNVVIVTFNYDRCIEHYVSHAVGTYFGMSLRDAQVLTQRLTVFHPYGQIGNLPWQVVNGKGNEFGSVYPAHSLMSMASTLRTFTEQVEQDATLDTMRNHLLSAECVVYLGFSYGDMNMELLTVKDEGPKRKVFGTTYGMSFANTASAKEAIHHSMTPSFSIIETVELASLSCNQLLKDYWKPIMN